jgi:hypothetical protein
MANGSLADGAIAKENDLNEQKMSMNSSNRAKCTSSSSSSSGADTCDCDGGEKLFHLVLKRFFALVVAAVAHEIFDLDLAALVKLV